MNRFIENAYVYQENNQWYIDSLPFFEGIRLDENG
jgi:hypothetical protein